MRRTVLNGKIHRATVTDADLDYVGSLTLDADLCAAANFVAGEQVHVVDVTNGARLVTYVIVGEPGSGQVCVNGAAAHLVHPGDLVIVMSFVELTDDELSSHVPSVAHVDSKNAVLS